MSLAANKISRAFSRLGWIGFWIQAVLLILPIIALIYVASSKVRRDAAPLQFVNYLALAGLMLMAFTAFWSYRYTRLAARIANPDSRPPWSSVARTVWIGVLVALIGMTISLLLLIIEISGLLMLLLKAPQGGVPVFQTSADDRSNWVSTINVVSLLAELCTVVGEVFLLGISLWLLFRLTKLVGCFKVDDEPAMTETPSES